MQVDVNTAALGFHVDRVAYEIEHVFSLVSKQIAYLRSIETINPSPATPNNIRFLPALMRTLLH
jgi:hypothetical protein